MSLICIAQIHVTHLCALVSLMCISEYRYVFTEFSNWCLETRAHAIPETKVPSDYWTVVAQDSFARSHLILPIWRRWQYMRLQMVIILM